MVNISIQSIPRTEDTSFRDNAITRHNSFQNEDFKKTLDNEIQKKENHFDEDEKLNNNKLDANKEKVKVKLKVEEDPLENKEDIFKLKNKIIKQLKEILGDFVPLEEIHDFI